MNNPTFLTIARQGKNGWQRYLLGILVIAGMMTIVIIPVAMITFVGIYTSGTPLEKINQGNVQELISQSLIFGKPIPLIIFGGAINAMSLAGLFLAVTRVHKRPFRTLLSPEPEASMGACHLFSEKFKMQQIRVNGRTHFGGLIILPKRVTCSRPALVGFE